MIKVNGEEIKIEHFPDGTQRLKMNCEFCEKEYVISWVYEKEEELSTLIYITRHLRNLPQPSNPDVQKIYLVLSYLPNARMDRIKSYSEVFTLKYFCDVINWLNFDVVQILDVHSNVGAALLDRVNVLDSRDFIYDAIYHIEKDDSELILFFPDEGCVKRLADMFPRYKWISSQKKRDWETGKILGLDITTNGIDLNGKTILMCDDIVSYGGSFKYSADKLKELGVGKIYAYATHTENSVLNRKKGTLIKSLEDGTVERLFTTDSLFTGKHEKITIVDRRLD